MRVVRVLFLFTGMVCVGIGLVALRTATRQTGYRISSRLVEQQELKRTCFDRELEIGRLVSPERLDAEGRKLDLEPPAPGGAAAPAAGTMVLRNAVDD